jgi:hypothetical protein
MSFVTSRSPSIALLRVIMGSTMKSSLRRDKAPPQATLLFLSEVKIVTTNYHCQLTHSPESPILHPETFSWCARWHRD